MTPHPFGLHRSLDPPGVLPQAAWRLDADPVPRQNELAIEVSSLNVDSASLRQLLDTERATGETVEEQIPAGVDVARRILGFPEKKSA